LLDLIIRFHLQRGSPVLFPWDHDNRMNLYTHGGMIYACSLSTDIAQNMSPTVQYEDTIDGDTIITYKKAGDFVVCNLSSIHLGKAVPDGVLERLIPIQVRMLDNVIDLNTISVKQAALPNKKYPAIG